MRGETRRFLAPLPRFVRARLVRPPAVPWASEASGAVLFVDIDGFTPMTRRIVCGDPRGAERLTALVNGLLGPVVSVIERRGGDVLKFGGDAVLALFARARDAEAAALGIRTAIRRLRRRSAAHRRVGATIALDHGRVLLGEVGDVGRIDALAAGEALARVARLEAAAPKGSLVRSPAFRAALRDESLRAPVGAVPRRRPPPVGSIPAAAVAPRLDARVAARLASAGSAALLLEHRQGAFLFVHARPPAGAGVDWYQAVVADVLGALRPLGGGLLRSSTDAHGFQVLAAFGVPQAVEDAAAAAAEAARRIVRGLAAAGVEARAGLEAGSVFAGFLGTDSRREYTAMGDAVNVAARLGARAAPGEVLVGPAAAATLVDRAGTEARRLRLKGQGVVVAARLALDRAVGPRPPGAAPLVVGRAAEVGRIERFVENLARGRRPAPIWIAGEAGLGKTTLGLEIDRRARAAGVEVVRIEFRSADAHAPFAATRGLLPAGAEADEATLRAEERLARRAARLAEALAAAPGPRLVLVEDLHWTDDGSAAAIAALARGAPRRGPPPVGLVALSRPLDPAPAWTAEAERIDLAPLGAADVRTLAEALDVRLADRTLAALLERSGGNPLYVTTLLGLLRTRRDLPIGAFPSDLRDLLAARLDAAPPEADHAALAAAVLGSPFAADDVGALLDIDGAAARAAIRLGVEAIFAPAAGPGERWAFAHPLLEEAAYARLSEAARRRLHTRALRRLGARADETAREAARARHLAGAGRRVAAAAAYARAAARAEGAGAPTAAEALVGSAVAILLAAGGGRAARRRADLLEARGRLRKHLGRYAEALEDYHAAARLYRRIGLLRRAVHAEDMAAGCLRWAGRHAEALRAVSRALVAAERLGDRALLATCLNTRAGIHWYLGRYRAAIRDGRRSVAIRRRLGDRAAVGRGLFALGNSYVRLCEIDAAEATFGELLHLARRTADPLGVAYAQAGLGVVALRRGLLADAVARFEEALDLRTRREDRRGVVYCLLRLGDARREAGLLDEAEALYDRARAALAEVEDRNLEGIVVRSIAGMRLRRGDVAAAREGLAEAERIAAETGYFEERLRLGLLAAAIRAAEGDATASVRLASAARRRAARAGMRDMEAVATAILADAAATALARRRAAGLYAAARRIAEGIGFVPLEAEILCRRRDAVGLAPVDRDRLEALVERLAAGAGPYADDVRRRYAAAPRRGSPPVRQPTVAAASAKERTDAARTRRTASPIRAAPSPTIGRTASPIHGRSFTPSA